MNFDEAARRAVEALQSNTQRAGRPAIADVLRAKRRRAGVTTMLLTFVGSIVVVGAVSLWSGAGPGQPAAISPTPPALIIPSTTSTTAATSTTEVTVEPSEATPGWSIAYPSTWHRADSELMPDLGWDSLTLGTFPLRAGGENCAHTPENALRDLGPDDALISVLFSDVSGPDVAPWPENGFNDRVFPESGATDNHECSDRPELEVHWGPWSIDGNGVYVLVAFGENMTADARTQTWEVLSSLRAADNSTASTGAVCVVTRPPQPGFAPPDPYHPDPSDESMVWYGTASLWTPLRTDATYVQRKSVWWSIAFRGGAQEERPDISVTYQRLDIEAPVISGGSPGTNAYTQADGDFMIADIDPETSGCWKVTATYKDAVLSYVYQAP